MPGAPADDVPDADVAPVGCVDKEENTESEKVDPFVVVAVCWELRKEGGEDGVAPLGLLSCFRNSDATLAMSPPPALKLPNAFKPPKPPVCWGCWGCACGWLPPALV